MSLFPLFYIIIRTILFLILLSALYQLSANGQDPLPNDSIVYIAQSRLPLFSSDFFFNRPFFYPLFIKIWQQNYYLIFITQYVISLFAWLFLAYCTRQQFKNKKTALIAFSLLLLLSCSGYIVAWDGAILTESLTLSISILFFGLFISAFKNEFRPLYLFLMAITDLILLNIRDANLFFVLATGFLIFILSLLTYKKHIIPIRSTCIFLIVLLIGAGFSQWTMNKGIRWIHTFGNIMSDRFTSHHNLVDYFVRQGMPTSMLSNITQESEHRSSPVFIPYARNTIGTAWIIKNGKTVYEHYLFTHPAYVFSPYSNPDFWLSLTAVPYLSVAYYAEGHETANTNNTLIWDALSHQTKSTLPQELISLTQRSGLQNYFFGLKIFLTLLGIVNDFILVVLVIIAGKVFCTDSASRKISLTMWAIMCLFLLMTTLGLLFVWHADALEITRHQLTNRLLISIMVFLTSFMILDKKKI